MQIYDNRSQAYAECFPSNAVGAELGVLEAANAQALFVATSPTKLYLVDNQPTDASRTFIACRENCILIDRDITDWLQSLASNTLDWCYLDASHLIEHTRKELAQMCRVVRKGGIIGCHDFTVEANPGPGPSPLYCGYPGYWGCGVVVPFLEAIMDRKIMPLAITNERFASLFCEVL